ncbi:tat pathway signal sequence [Actinokineospora sp. NPDC004072]
MRRAPAVMLVVLTACGTPSTPVEAPAVTSAEACPHPESGFDCDFQRRFDLARRYAADRPGATAIVVRDREAGVVWRNEHAGEQVWTASTIKLAMAADLLVRARAGEIALTAQDRDDLAAMLYDSDDQAATDLWMRYSGEDHQLFNAHFPRLGLATLRPQPGYGRVFPYWGFQKCTADDLDRLLVFVLGSLDPDDRAFLVDRMRAVAPNQQWGVWSAGPAARPGTKNGWAEEDTGWVMNSIGFVGPAERYTVVVLNDLRGDGGYDEGRETTSEVVRLLFAGRF